MDEIISFNPPEIIKTGTIAKKISMEKLAALTREISGYENAVYSSGPKFKNGDILLAKITPCLENGKTAFVDILDDGETAFGSTEFIVLRAIEEMTENRFVYYFARSPAFREKAIKCMEGTSGRKRVNDKALKKQILPIPDINGQKSIAAILSSLDDKIALNNKINKELEYMAKALYDYWFVQFDFPNDKGKPYKSSGGKMVYSNELKRKIPQGWEVKQAKEILGVLTGKEDANIADINGKYKFFTCADEPLLCNSFVFDGSSVLIAGNGNFNVKHYTGKFNAYQRTYVLIPSEIKYYAQLYFAAKDSISKFAKGSNGSIVKFITKGDVDKIIILDSPDSKYQLFLNDILYNIETNLKENEQLASLRDFLLPMLMNGQITVNTPKRSKK
jgi:type I restriction enzyme S subunit